MFSAQEKFMNEFLGDIFQRIREVFDRKIDELHNRNKKISDLKLKHLKEIYDELVKTYRADFENYIKGNVKEIKLTNFEFLFEKFIEPHIKWMYKMLKTTYHEEHDEPPVHPVG